MRVRQLGPADFVRQRWKNGGGFTTEHAVHEEGGRRIWRLSTAEVAASGPFSDFTGFERTLMLLEGNGMVLTFDAASELVVDQRYTPVRFDGGWPTEGRLLDGPVKDLNLMVASAHARGSMDGVELASPAQWAVAADWALLLVLRGSARLCMAGERFDLSDGELLRIDEARGAEVVAEPREPGTVLADIRIQRT